LLWLFWELVWRSLLVGECSYSYILDQRTVFLYWGPGDQCELWEGHIWNSEEEGDTCLAKQISWINPGDQWGDRCHSQITFTSCAGYFGDGVWRTSFLSWPQIAILPILAFQIARITGVSHQHLAIITTLKTKVRLNFDCFITLFSHKDLTSLSESIILSPAR
jgi:hypothetical protein